MELIEYRGFKNIFIGLAKYDKDQYCIIYGKTKDPIISLSEGNIEVTGGWHNEKLINFRTEKSLDINISFISNHGTLYNIQTISDKNEYYTILSILENLL